MKIFLLGPCYPYRGGISDTNEELAQTLHQQGHTIEVINFKMLYPSILFPGTTQYYAKDEKDLNFRNLRLINSINFFSWNKVVKKINSSKIDVLISSHWTSSVSICMTYINSRVSEKIKKIGLIHNAHPHENSLLSSFFLKRYLRSLNEYVAFSKAVKEQIENNSPEKIGKTFFLPVPNKFGKPIESIVAKKKLKLCSKTKYLMFFGIIRPYKGLDLLIKAFDLLRKTKNNIELLIVGENYESINNYQSLKEFSNNKKYIRFINKFIDEKMLKYWFSAADIVIQPYKNASQSGVTSLAINFEKILITTKTGGLSELIENEKNGFICEVNFHDIYRTIDKALNCDKNIVIKNLRRTKKKLSWKNFTKKLF